MPYLLKTNQLRYKDPDSGNYKPIDVFAGSTIAELQQQISQNAADILAMQQEIEELKETIRTLQSE